MNFKHGLSKTPEYRCWQQIKERCLNPKHKAYPDYGGRGITIDPVWVQDFEAFYSFVGNRPTAKHSLDRIENSRGYEPGNVRWATMKEQNNNRRPPKPRGPRRVKVPSEKVTNFKHGLIHTSEYKAWIAMKDRCLNPNSSNFHGWGAKGVSVHTAWREDFTVFLKDVGPKPSAKHSLDRYPNKEGYYEPGNVRWATKYEQTHNRRPLKRGSEHGNFEHGGTGTEEHKTWISIKSRCFNPRYDRYKGYGGAGITMCSRWREDFVTFRDDIGPRPSPQHNIMRENPTGHYSCGKCTECVERGWLSNCRWGTKTEQNRNRRPSGRSGKLNELKVKDIRALLEAGDLHERDIAAMFGVGQSLIGKIRRREIWK